MYELTLDQRLGGSSPSRRTMTAPVDVVVGLGAAIGGAVAWAF